ncbi:FAD-dependent monooxygenase [Thermostaphylospora chromogena]|uniref:2-polyprenyl-6-methoxyphenol hydroxylase n=1 Tax=Thermostaphylospora chromogena TaxID=35622 RepID=A0A1H1I0R2_9ACTN|nr:FAD-dependent monooxygenase [Thermostaphylospora chromogena]SDR31284.1 2-polyprenyl-6-methoxyphenol hydroxylase [Thermostaphylospora chromogena]
MTAPSVIVVGGGIGGLAAAVALDRAGATVTVHERAAEPGAARAGHGLVLWHNAVLALRRLGLGPEIEKIGYELHRYVFQDGKGRAMADWPVARMAERFDAPVYSVSRPELHRMLSEQVGDRLVLDSRCTGFTADPDGVTVTFADGRELRADLLIGADGLRSTVRAALRPNEPPPRYAGFTAFQGVIDASGSGMPEHTFLTVWGRGRWFVCYRLPDDRVYWDGVLSDRVEAPLGTTAAELLDREFGDWPEPIPRLLAATGEHALRPVQIFDRPPARRWSHGRVTLLGDAAHPMTFNLGQGAGQAIEDAVVLAQTLDPADLTGTLTAYEQRRVDRTARMVRRSRANGELTRLTHPLAVAARNAFMRVAMNRLIFRKTYELTMAIDWSER